MLTISAIHKKEHVRSLMNNLLENFRIGAPRTQPSTINFRDGLQFISAASSTNASCTHVWNSRCTAHTHNAYISSLQIADHKTHTRVESSKVHRSNGAQNCTQITCNSIRTIGGCIIYWQHLWTCAVRLRPESGTDSRTQQKCSYPFVQSTAPQPLGPASPVPRKLSAHFVHKRWTEMFACKRAADCSVAVPIELRAGRYRWLTSAKTRQLKRTRTSRDPLLWSSTHQIKHT